MFKTFINPRVKLLDPNPAEEKQTKENHTQYKCDTCKQQYKTDVDGTIMILTDKTEFLEHIYNRYRRIRIDTLIDVIEILRKSTSSEAAISIIRTYIAKNVGLVTDNIEESVDLFSKGLKRGNMRNKSKVGL